MGGLSENLRFLGNFWISFGGFERVPDGFFSIREKFFSLFWRVLSTREKKNWGFGGHVC